MASTAATVSPAAPASVESEVSLARLYVLRALYLLLVIGGAVVFLPQLIGHEPTARGVIPSMLGGLWVLACFGLRYPLQMLPILLFELLWKTIWLIDYGLPQVPRSGRLPGDRASVGHAQCNRSEHRRIRLEDPVRRVS